MDPKPTEQQLLSEIKAILKDIHDMMEKEIGAGYDDDSFIDEDE